MSVRLGIDIGSDTIKAVIIDDREGGEPRRIDPRRITGKPVERLREVLQDIAENELPGGDSIFIAITGSGAAKVSSALGVKALAEIEALSASLGQIEEDMREDMEHVIEIGAETQKYLSFFRDEKTGARLLEDVIPGGKCAGGSGSFLDYMHRRLKYESIEDFIQTGLQVKDPASISGRCAVFAESDIVHHYQKGTSRDRIVAGIHQAVARNCKSLLGKGTFPEKKVALVGGVAKNKCIIRHLARELELKEQQIVVPQDPQHVAAMGAALLAEDRVNLQRVISCLDGILATPFDYDHAEPITLKESQIWDYSGDELLTGIHIPLASLGVDIGSVSTKAAVIAKIDGRFRVLASHYRRTEGNPIEAVKDVLGRIQASLEERDIQVDKMIAATTGSGRYLTGYFLGANEIRDEITAQAAGVSTFILDEDLTVIEIGGQDSKFMRIRNGVISDFEMNWACAAGTGALIEKHAKNLDIPITRFGGLALAGDKPPIINSTCAVFSEAALMYFQQNNVSVENLCAGACLASARNYIIKVVRNRQMGEKVAFQGAVAFNRGMVGAFETVLGRPVIVPPYPHLTGAIGCARVAYETDEKNPVPSRFKGFEEVIGSQYQLSCFTCRKCGNECSVNTFQVGGETFHQGDRCDRYSGVHKKSMGSHLPDLFREREEMLMSSFTGKAPAGAKTVGFPRGLLFNQYFPLFNVFFQELGFGVMPSEPTSKKIIRKGIEKVVAEPCFPVKVAHGHAADILEQKPDFIFLPAVMRGEKPCGNFDLATTCPYVQSGPDVIKAALEIDGSGVKLLSPVLFLDRGYRHLERKMIALGKELGKDAREVKAALKAGLKALDEFNEKLAKRGRQVLDGLRKDEVAFVIIARPYALYDPGINMNVAKKVRDEGYLAIPQDMLPLYDREYDVSDTWTNIYPLQGQKKLSAARFLKSRPNLHALVVTYFGCGPDAFLDQMFYEEINRQYLTIQIDEHTSDTGILTRIQAYLSSAHSSRPGKSEGKIAADSIPLAQAVGLKVWLPNMNTTVNILAGVMRAHGIDAHGLPQSKDSALTLARDRISGDVCVPMLFTTQDMLERVSQPDFDPEREAFFQGKSGGPCRYGLYFMIEKVLMERLAGKPIKMVTAGNKNTDGGLGSSFLVMVWDSLVAHDLLLKMQLHTRPYEVRQGDSDRILEKYVGILEKAVEDPRNKPDNIFKLVNNAAGGSLEYLVKILKDAMREFQGVEVRRVRRPLVGVVGEFYVRQHAPSNGDMVRLLEKMGCEVWMAPCTEFFGYSNYISGVHAEDHWKDAGSLDAFKEVQFRKLLYGMATGHEHRLFDAVRPYVGHMPEIDPKEVVDLGEAYITPFFGGEAILSLGKAEDFAARGLDGIIAVGPFNCMPGLVVSALSRELRRKHNKIPFLNIDFDGFQDNARDQWLSAFVSQVRERMKAGVSREELAATRG